MIETRIINTNEYTAKGKSATRKKVSNQMFADYANEMKEVEPHDSGFGPSKTQYRRDKNS